MFFLFLCLLLGGLFFDFIRKYIFRIKDPTIEEVWVELDKEEWYKTLLQNPKNDSFIEYEKKHGLLSDPYYVRKIIENEGHREGFIHYLTEKNK
ncbi:hypothetical protein [Peribacillus alkalitolerans]|uniref:hypothetical protein n=1 Tax=Peribacillus alkalitolerans TaxID=1550385 RepID=UPI0013CFDEC9|nr:hypothetical protein [Peribacillus alkalitolerans]